MLGAFVWQLSFLLIFGPGRADHAKNARNLIQCLVHVFCGLHFFKTFASGRPDHIKNARKLVQRLVHAFGSFRFY